MDLLGALPLHDRRRVQTSAGAGAEHGAGHTGNSAWAERVGADLEVFRSGNAVETDARGLRAAALNAHLVPPAAPKRSAVVLRHPR